MAWGGAWLLLLHAGTLGVPSRSPHFDIFRSFACFVSGQTLQALHAARSGSNRSADGGRRGSFGQDQGEPTATVQLVAFLFFENIRLDASLGATVTVSDYDVYLMCNGPCTYVGNERSFVTSGSRLEATVGGRAVTPAAQARVFCACITLSLSLSPCVGGVGGALDVLSPSLMPCCPGVGFSHPVAVECRRV